MSAAVVERREREFPAAAQDAAEARRRAAIYSTTAHYLAEGAAAIVRAALEVNAAPDSMGAVVALNRIADDLLEQSLALQADSRAWAAFAARAG